MDMSQYLGVFIDEAREHLQNLNDRMTELEERADDPDLINSIFRSAHTLKGSAGQMGFHNMMELTHKMENIFDALRHGQLNVTSDVIDVLYETMDLLESMVDTIEQGGTDEADVSEMVGKLKAIVGGSTGGKHGAGGNDNQKRAGEKASSPGEEQGGTDRRITFDEYERDAIRQALSVHMNVFEVHVTIRRDCLLKAARALMVYQEVCAYGDVIKSLPSVEDLENEKFDRTFVFVVVSENSDQAIHDAIMNISEIEQVDVIPVAAEAGAGKEKGAGKETMPKETKSEKVGGNQTGVRQKTDRPVVAKTIRVNLDRLDLLMNLFEELVIARGRLEIVAASMHHPPLAEAVGALKSVSDRLQETVLNLRMEPVEQVFNRFPRMVRSLSKQLDKKVKLVISGAETELDRTVIDQIGDPLMHMIRNSMDHGIEHPADREKAGKNPEGRIDLRAYHSGNHVFIEIEDDGAGINREKVLKKAVEKGVVAAEVAEKMTDKEVCNLLFASGFSTADTISDISGRGVGLDVVKSKIHALSGSVEVDSSPGKGTRFTVALPLTLSIINALLIQCADETYAIPLNSIVETQLRRKARIKSVNRREVMTLRDRVVPLIDLKNYFGVPEGADAAPEEEDRVASRSIVIVRHGSQLAGLITDRLIGYQDIVIKPLSAYLKSVDGFSGATILGDGHVALILDCQSIMNHHRAIVLKEEA